MHANNVLEKRNSASPARTSARSALALLRHYAGLLLSSIALLFVIMLIMFVLLQLTPGDPIQSLVGNMPTTPAFRHQMESAYGLDEPIPVQFVKYIENLVTGNFGFSYANHQAVLPLVLSKLVNTLLISVPALILAAIGGMVWGLLAGRTRSNFMDTLMSALGVMLFSIPTFWLGLLLILLFSVTLGVFPAQGMGPPDGGLSLANMVMPVVTMSAAELAFMFRVMRSSVIEVLGQDYIDTARSKGLAETQILRRHVLGNAMLPAVSVLGYSVGFTIAGSVLVETVFGWPGMGLLLFNSIQSKENMVVMAILFVVAVVVLLANILTDIAYGLLDPRMRARLRGEGTD